MKSPFSGQCRYCPEKINQGDEVQIITRYNTVDGKVSSPLDRIAHKECALKKGPSWVRNKLQKELEDKDG